MLQDSVALYISCEGQWRKTRGCWTFNGTKTKGMKVSNDITYRELLERICISLQVDRSQYVLDMRYLPGLVGPLAPARLCNLLSDDKSCFFLHGEAFVFQECSSFFNIPP